ncbi:MAG: CbtA family protein [Proteobacteria bacterium]|nr:CbtA family protein [Pseudomonadota bacterium]
MFRRILITALLAGFLGGLGISVVQQFTTAPIIHHAEEYESKGAPGGHKHGVLDNGPNSLLLLAQATEMPPAENNVWAPADGLERTLYSTLANIIAGIGFALILVACIALSGRNVDGRTGVLWGIAGFAVINLAPALGLPPEVPGAMAAELGARQGWWLLCVAATAVGLWMLIFRHGAFWVVGGIVIMALPHLMGAPQPARIGGPVPPELAGHFVAASLVTAAIFWCALGWLSGTFWQRLGAR